MGLNFFINETNVSSVSEFGIVDPAQNSTSSNKTAYVDYTNPSSWNTKIISNNRTDIMFNAIDGNVDFYRSWKNVLELQRRCDAMIYTSDAIIFLEIKDWNVDHNRKTFTESAIEQLENTIVHFCTAHPNFTISKKYAYVSNKKQPMFHYSAMNSIQKFKENTNGYILKVGSEITL